MLPSGGQHQTTTSLSSECWVCFGVAKGCLHLRGSQTPFQNGNLLGRAEVPSSRETSGHRFSNILCTGIHFLKNPIRIHRLYKTEKGMLFLFFYLQVFIYF